MKFIKLTLENTGNETFVNAEKITDFQINSKGTATTIAFGKDEYFFVKETPEEIIQLIENVKFEIIEERIEELKLKDIEVIEDYLNTINLNYDVIKVNENWLSICIEKEKVLVSFMFCNGKFVNLLVYKDDKIIMDKNRTEK